MVQLFTTLNELGAENSDLTKKEFEEKYGKLINRCMKLGNHGWVVSKFSNYDDIENWINMIENNNMEEIIMFFEHYLNSIFEELKNRYYNSPEYIYFFKAKNFFEKEDYMTSSMYATALIDYRVNTKIDFSKIEKPTNRNKFSNKGFSNHAENEYKNVDNMFKTFLFACMYPSLIEFLKRLFVDGKNSFKSGNEPNYLNRSWLMHGRVTRQIQRFECLQLFNALDTLELLFLVDGKHND